MDQYVPAESADPKIQYYQWNLDRDEFPVDLSEFDQVFLLDIIEHLKEPESIHGGTAAGRGPEAVRRLSSPPRTSGSFVTRAMLLLGHFNYGRKGILDRTHTRLFTFSFVARALRAGGL